MRTSTLAALVALVGALGVMTNPAVKAEELQSRSNQSFFGTVAVFDDSITVGPDEASLEIGRGRGFYIFDQNSTIIPGKEFSWTAEFNQASGYTPGSTLTFKGFDRTLDPVREIAIVRGTGDFRLARGWAVITTYSQTGIGNANLNFTAHFLYGF